MWIHFPKNQAELSRAKSRLKFEELFYVQLKIIQEKGVQKKLVAFEINGKGIPRHDYPIMNVEGVTIGKVTSGTMSPSLNKGIGMGYVPMGSHQLGSEIFIGIRHKKVPATICKTPFL